MSDKGYRRVENELIGQLDNKRKPKPIVAASVRKPVKKIKIQVEHY